MPTEERLRENPRAYALELIEEGLVSSTYLLLCALNYMSRDDVRNMMRVKNLLVNNEDEDEDDDEDEDEDED